jgi:hypothetical protein
MSLQLKNICSIKLKGEALFNSIFKNIPTWKQFINENTSFENKDNELNVFCIQNMYSYNSGFIGSIINKIGIYGSYLVEPLLCNYLSSDIKANDIEVLCFLLSMLSRYIPINNLFNHDLKNELCNTLQYKNKYSTIPSLLNLKSLFCFNPIFDSGCIIFSNKEPFDSGFVKWTKGNKTKNKGLIWCFYKTEKKGITIINMDCNEDIISCVKEIVILKNNLDLRFNIGIENYETYIVGNFNIELNMHVILDEIKEVHDILKNANLEIINNKEPSSTEFILQNINNENEYSDLSVIENDISPFYKYEIQNKINCTYNPDFNIEIKEEEPKFIHTINPLSILSSLKESYFDTHSHNSDKSEKSDEWEKV